MALCQKFGRLLIGAEARFFARTDITNFSTSLDQSPTPKQIHTRLPPGYNAPNAFALFTKDQLTGQSGGLKMVKIVSTNWKSLDEKEKQNYSERAKKIGDELRDNFEKLTDDQKKDLWDKHVEKMNKRRRLQMKMKLNKFHAETNRPKQPLSSYMLFVKERFVKHTEPFKTRDERLKFVVETGQQWRQMTDAEKKPYGDQAQGDRAEYRMELAEWKQNHADEIKAWKEANKPKAKAALKEKRQKKVLKPKKTKAAKALKRGSKQKKTKEVKAKAEGSVEKEEWSSDDEEEAIQQEKRQKKVQKRGRKPKKTEKEPEAEGYVENAAPKMTET
uniref:HMG box domain-containing protein n=1 Tax=Globodera rostochiensis TaxID=31243 RepID=A0A914GXG9_GLORO